VTRDEWKAWFVELRGTHADAQVLDSIADMGEMVDILHAVRMADPLNRVAELAEDPA
jgi:hypothetical protein